MLKAILSACGLLFIAATAVPFIFPVYLKLSYEPEAVAQQPRPSADREEREEAGEKIEKVGQRAQL